ncbi:MAG: hypothetical protein JSW08_02880, partial [archaeon]
AGTAYLYRDDVEKSSPEIITLTANPDGYAYKVNSTGNENYSDNSSGVTYYLKINKASTSVNLLINDSSSNWSSTYPNSTYKINATVSISGLTVTLYRNDTQINQGTTSVENITTYPAIIYYFKGNTTGNENYSSSESITYWINISKGNPDLHLYLNGTEDNQSYQVPTTVNASATKNTGTEGTLELLSNGTVINSTSSSYTENLTYYDSVDYWNYTIRFNATENYSSQSVTYFVNLTEAPPDNNPSVTLNSPAPNYNTNSTSITFNCSAYDNLNLTNVSLYGNWSGGWHNNETNTSGINNTDYTFSKIINNGVYSWLCEACDNSSQCTNTSTRMFTIDSAPPTYNNDGDDSGGSVGEGSIVNVYVYWQDISLDTAIFRTNQSGTWENISTCSLTGISGWCNKTINTLGNAGETICWNQYANDSLSNTNASMPETTHCFDVNINEAPNVTLISPENGSNTTNNYVNFSCNATDDYQLANATLYWNYSGTWEENGTNTITGTENETSFYKENLINTEILWACLVYDNAGNSSWSENRTVTIAYVGTPPPVSGGGRRYECQRDSDCDEGYSCWNSRCLKLFDVKIIRVDSPVPPSEFLDFTYLVKGMADVSGDVILTFWIEKGGIKASSGSDTIYFGSFEEKIETTSLFLPSDIEEGVYTFYVQVNFQGHNTTAYRVIEVKSSQEATSVVDINIIKLPSNIAGDLSNFSFILGSNRDSPILVNLEEEIRKKGQVIWHKEKELEIVRSEVIFEELGRLGEGNYEIELKAHYNNKTVKLLQNFSIGEKTNYLPLILFLIIIAIVVFLVLFWVKISKKIKRLLFVKKEPEEPKEIEEAVLEEYGEEEEEPEEVETEDREEERENVEETKKEEVKETPAEEEAELYGPFFEKENEFFKLKKEEGEEEAKESEWEEKEEEKVEKLEWEED